MAETQKWMFIGDVPLLYEARRVARQLQIEMWLDPSPILKALNSNTTSPEKPCQLNYVA